MATSNVPTSFPSLYAHIVLFTTFILFLLPMASSNYFQFPNFYPATTDGNALYQGDAVTSVGAVEFNSITPPSLVGWVTYAQQVRLWDSETGVLSDFTTSFSFTIDTLGSPTYGDGLAFFLAPVGSQIPPNSAGGYLGLFNATTSNSAKNQMVVVEFDSFPDPGWDPTYEHIGINSNSIGSIITTPWNASLHSGETCHASITYNATTKNLSLFWSYGGNSNSQGNSSLSYQLDLRDILPEWVMLGFSAATGNFEEKHTLESWAFSSDFDTKTTSQKHAKDTKLIVGITVSFGVLIFGAVILIGALIVRKRSGRKSVCPSDGQSQIGLVQWVWDLYGRGQILSAVDERIKSDFDSNEVECLMIVGLWCAYPDHSLRPSIKQAIQVLHFEAPMPNLPLKMPVAMYQVPSAATSRVLKNRTIMTEEEVPEEIEHVEQSPIHASDGEIEPVEHLLELMEECSFEDFMKLGSRSDKKVHEDKDVEPKCGMIFDTADEAYTFYNGYARKIGFSVRKLRTNKSKADRNKILRQFILEHTHDLAPPQSAHYLRSHRRIESSQVGLINKMHSSGFKQSDIYSYMSNEAGGPQYLNFIPSDCYNLLQRKRVEFLKKGDSQCLLKYFKQKQQENKHFFYSFRTTEENEAIACRREKEREAENKTQQTSPILVSRWSVECEAAEKYTKKVFYYFQREYQQTLDLSLQLENDDGTIGSYIVKELVGWKRIRKVAYNRLEHSVSCTCRKFEFHGILCSHALKVFCDLQHESLPLRYYLKRWTRTIVDEDVFDLHGDLIPNDNDPSLTIRYSALSQISQRIVSKSSKFPDVSALTKVGLLELDAKVDSWISSRCANENVASNTQTNSTLNLDDEAPLRDPTKRKRSQGNKRKRGALEGKGEGSTTEAMIVASQPSQEVEENITLNESGMQYIGGQGYMGSFMCPNMNQGPHVEQQNVARRLQFQSHLMVEESIGDGGYEV
ncbi:hypothetical protein Vadar_010350 [Vaccinium darrowii]|uniref:Uncharacterized protein n=1 Tax=Vaccinium darrowii TaxID=229202 RepID=A0ACB7Z5F1_9ERIC|nr:hypothetical protein Vadar_010350 [Vaccinium darrowii]